MTIKFKQLHGITEINGRMRTFIQYNINTNHITIGNTFTISKLKPLNKKSTNYLGITCAEQVLSKVFKDVQVMPHGNKGYDFICNNGYKIDSKASCKNKDNNWLFNIKQNKTADYFTCLEFDNRTNLNPKYIWLIPGKDVNDKQTISISESTINKWDEYKLDINKVITCCNNIKGDK